MITNITRLKSKIINIIIFTLPLMCKTFESVYANEYSIPYLNNGIYLYSHYILNVSGFHGEAILNLNADHSFTYNDEFAGTWEVSHDTLFLYENYIYTPTAEDKNFYTALIAPTPYNRFFCLPRNRQVVFIDPESDYPFELNVTAFKIYNYGAWLESIGTSKSFEVKACYYPQLETELIHTQNTPLEYQLNNIGLIDTSNSPWKLKAIRWADGTFKVTDINRIDEKVGIIELECEGVIYHIVNPRFYLKNDTVQLYDPRDEVALSEWMDTVSVGNSYNFQLQRPAYPVDSIKNIPQLQSDPNTLYIGEKEAYGYFFARIKK